MATATARLAQLGGAPFLKIEATQDTEGRYPGRAGEGRVGAPFLKIEATKYTEVGYHGRDVESMIRDLTDIAIGMIKQEQRVQVETKAKERVTERLLDLL